LHPWIFKPQKDLTITTSQTFLKKGLLGSDNVLISQDLGGEITEPGLKEGLMPPTKNFSLLHLLNL